MSLLIEMDTPGRITHGDTPAQNGVEVAAYIRTRNSLYRFENTQRDADLSRGVLVGVRGTCKDERFVVKTDAFLEALLDAIETQSGLELDVFTAEYGYGTLYTSRVLDFFVA